MRSVHARVLAAGGRVTRSWWWAALRRSALAFVLACAASACLGCGGGATITPRQASGMGQHACAVWSDGTVRCAGTNAHGELGDGTHVDRREFEPVSGLGGARAVAVGMEHACAIV